MQHLFDLATELGVQVEYTDLTHLGRDGDYNRHTRTIRLQEGMLYRHHRSVLAHEIAHAIADDETTMFAHINERQERRADEWAAHYLIDRDEYQMAERKYGANIEWIAQELCVTDELVEAYERTLHRVGDSVYVNPKMGAGQWAQKVTA